MINGVKDWQKEFELSSITRLERRSETLSQGSASPTRSFKSRKSFARRGTLITQKGEVNCKQQPLPIKNPDLTEEEFKARQKLKITEEKRIQQESL